MRHLIANDEDELPEAIKQLSQGGLTCVSPKMLKFGGDLLMEFSKRCGKKFSKDTPHLSSDILKSDALKATFKDCVDDSDSVSSEVLNTVYSEISMKIINARVNEMLKAKQEIELEKEGKVVNNTQGLRETLKTYSIIRQRHL